ncbi:Glycosyl transferase family 2 [Nocardioides exalbidus]|uniref:Glycosyl transferase family 2 n=1 Tax=Nocardioides exalbidus TaxID=402596 RepID=A0A1H4L9R6_9ACTN|nr:glycosyltransferase family 2 protein [Nocardioides exalbidus]SEB67481.1 Glycosyl transferase family 2 [Nocardioides exalbidus]
MSVSIVIPHYGADGPTRALVAQLAPQVVEKDGQIIVVDDASPEPLEDIPGARVIRREVNSGFGATVNAGVAEVTTELVAILNSDLQVADDFIETYVAAARPWLPAVVAPRVVTHGHDGATSFRFPTARTVLAQRIGLLANRRDRRWASDLIGEDKPPSPEDEHVVDWVSGAAMLLPTADLRAVGGFDDRFHMYLEEVDLQRRLRERGLKSVYLGHVVVHHLGFGSSDPGKRERWQTESWVKYADKWGWRRRLWLAMEGASAANLLVDSARRALGRDTTPVRDWKQRRALTHEVWSGQARRES